MILIKRNQSGAALMIVLFLVVLVSIVGTTMLSTTTYGLQKVVKTTKEQEEFYRSEGALEIVFHEMANYQDGPYQFLKGNKLKTYEIGEEVLHVEIETVPEINTIPSTYDDPIKVEFKAKYAEDSNISRTMTIDLNLVTNNPLPIAAYSYVTEEINKDITDDQFKISPKEIKREDYNKILSAYDVIWEKVQTPFTIDTKNGYTFPNGQILKFSSLSLSGNEMVTIPPNTIVFVRNLILSGTQHEAQLTVQGALIVETFDHRGNSKLNVESGIIANTIKGKSEAFVVDGDAKGISCDLLKKACNDASQISVDNLSTER
jgi:hypothetical protein